MDKETGRRIEEIRAKYRGNPDVEFLLNEWYNQGIKLVDADAMASAVDRAVERGILGSRSEVADARNNYGIPGTYDFASPVFLERLAGRRV
ncbi:MAG: hypothetical protein PHH00_02785 [Candidatus Nanoarchaeia archaeon]|nr:hypothetical protein [Candidatus Nanoarchaeia archaeon]